MMSEVLTRPRSKEAHDQVVRSDQFERAYDAALSNEPWPPDVPPDMAPLSYRGWSEGRLERALRNGKGGDRTCSS